MSEDELKQLYEDFKAKGFITEDLSLETFIAGTRVLESIRTAEDLAKILASLRPPQR